MGRSKNIGELLRAYFMYRQEKRYLAADCKNELMNQEGSRTVTY